MRRGCVLTLLILTISVVLVGTVLTIGVLTRERDHAASACAAIVKHNASVAQPVNKLSLADYVHTPLEVITAINIARLEQIDSFPFGVSELKLTANQIEFYDAAAFGYDLSALSPNQQQILLIEQGASEPSTIYICATRDNNVMYSFQADETANAVRFDPQTPRVAINEGRGTIQILDVNNWKRLTTLDVRHGEQWRNTNELAFHPTSPLLAFAMSDYINADYSIRIWDVDKRQQIATLSGYERPIIGLTFSEDGTILAASGVDGVVRLWGIPSEPA